MMLHYVIEALTLAVLIGLTFAYAALFKGVTRWRWGRVFIPFGQMIIIALLYLHLALAGAPDWLFVLVVMVALACTIVDIFLLKYLRLSQEKELEEERLRILEEQLVIQERYRDDLMREVGQAEQERLQIIEQLREAECRLTAGDMTSMEQSIWQALDKMGKSSQICQHVVLDALLSSKCHVCERLDIKVSFAVTIPHDIALPDIDMCAVFSNLLDNAINACQQLPQDERTIEVKAHIKNGFLAIKVINAFSNAEDVQLMSKDDAVSRDKTYLREHGWGQSIVEAIANRYNGMFCAEELDNTYKTIVLLRLQ